MDCIRLALVNLYKASPKQSHQSSVFLCFFTIYSITENPFINYPEQLREQNRTELNRTKLSLFPQTHSEIVVPFPFQLTNDCSKTTQRVTFMLLWCKLIYSQFISVGSVPGSSPCSFCNSECTCSLSHLFSLKPWKLHHPWCLAAF